MHFKHILVLVLAFVFLEEVKAWPLGKGRVPLLGAGVKVNLFGPTLTSCLKAPKDPRTQKEVVANFYYLKSPHHFKDLSVQQFVEKNKALVKRKKVSSFLIVIDLFKHVTFDSLHQLAFREDIQKLLDEKKLSSFFRTCGDHFTESLKKRSRILIFASFYGNRIKDRWIQKKTIKKRITNDPKDSFQINLLNDFEYNSFFHLDVRLEGVHKNIDFLYGLDKWKGKTLDKSIHRILKEAINGDQGTLLSYKKRLWSDTLPLKGLCQEARENKNFICDQRRRLFLKRLRNDLYLFKQKKRMAPTLCLKKMPSLHWEDYESCKEKLLRARRGDTRRISSCVKLDQALAQFFKQKECQNLSSTSPFLNPSLFQEKKLAIQKAEGHTLGHGVDLKGRLYKNCLKGRDLQTLPKSFNEDKHLYSYSPQKRGLLFSKMLTSLEFQTHSPKLPSRFQMDKIKDPLTFFKRCGTHFISGLTYKKGFKVALKMSHFRAYRKKTFSEDDKKKKKRARWLKKVKVTFSSLNPSLQNFSPQNLEEFLRQYPKIKKALSEEKKGIPFSMILTPWSDVLLWNDLVKDRDLDFFDQL